MPNGFSSLRSHCLRRVRGLLLTFILWRTPKNEPRKRAKGYALGSRAALPRSVRLADEARLKVFGKCRLFVLFGTASKTSWAGDLCPTLGELAADITKMGEYG